MKRRVLSLFLMSGTEVHAQDLGVEIAAAALERTNHFTCFRASCQKLAHTAQVKTPQRYCGGKA